MNDEKVVKAIKDGDETAINQVIEKYSKLMWSIAGAVLKNIGATEDVEECVADLFIYLWKNPDKYDATIIGEFIPSSVFIISPPRFM